MGGLLGIASALGLPLLNAGPWFDDHGKAGWTVALFVTAAAATVWTLTDRALADREAQLAQARQKLAARPAPTVRDKEQFDALLHYWDWDSGPLAWLSNGFNAKLWQDSDAIPIFQFVDRWRERYFDDADVQGAYSTFFKAVDELADWMAGESFPGSNVEQQVVPDGNERRDRGGWPAFDAVRKAGLHAAREVSNTRRTLEQVGRARGL